MQSHQAATDKIIKICSNYGDADCFLVGVLLIIFVLNFVHKCILFLKLPAQWAVACMFINLHMAAYLIICKSLTYVQLPYTYIALFCLVLWILLLFFFFCSKGYYNNYECPSLHQCLQLPPMQRTKVQRFKGFMYLTSTSRDIL